MKKSLKLIGALILLCFGLVITCPFLLVGYVFGFVFEALGDGFFAGRRGLGKLVVWGASKRVLIEQYTEPEGEKE